MVGVDQPVYVPSQHKHKPYSVQARKIVQVLTAVISSKLIFVNQTSSCIYSMCLNCVGKYQIALSKAAVGVDRPVYAL